MSVRYPVPPASLDLLACSSVKLTRTELSHSALAALRSSVTARWHHCSAVTPALPPPADGSIGKLLPELPASLVGSCAGWRRHGPWTALAGDGTGWRPLRLAAAPADCSAAVGCTGWRWPRRSFVCWRLHRPVAAPADGCKGRRPHQLSRCLTPLAWPARHVRRPWTGRWPAPRAPTWVPTGWAEAAAQAPAGQGVASAFGFGLPLLGRGPAWCPAKLARASTPAPFRLGCTGRRGPPCARFLCYAGSTVRGAGHVGHGTEWQRGLGPR